MENTFLLFDYDRSLGSIGGADGAEEAVGLPPIPMQGGLDSLRNKIMEVYTVVERPIEHPVLGETDETERAIVPTETADDYNIFGIIVDSVTRMAEIELENTIDRMNAVRAEEGKKELDGLDRNWWGNYGDAMVRFFRFLTTFEGSSVVTAHMGEDTTDENKRYYGVNMKSSAADKVQEYFDVVAYLDSENEGRDRFMRLRETRVHTQAKDRLNVLDDRLDFMRDGELREDALSHVLRAYRAEGVEHPDILLIGPSGGGKTLLLQTLNDFCVNSDE